MPNRSAGTRLLLALFYLLAPVLKPIARMVLGRNDRIMRKLRGARDRLFVGPPLSAGLEATFAKRLQATMLYLLGPAHRAGADNNPRHQDRPARPFGVNVAGYLTSEKGTGEAARSTIRLLEAAHIPYVLNNVVDVGSVNNETLFTAFSEDSPYAFNLIYVNPDQAANFAWHKGQPYFRGRYNVGAWNWELTNFPEEWHTCFQYYDELWVATNFVQEALAKISPVPVVRVPYAIQPKPERNRLGRAHFGLPADSFIFLFVFDFHSVFERKNPLGLIDAFKRTFGEDDNGLLIIKSSHADREAIQAMREASGSAHVKIIETVLSRGEINALYELCDCYVSLHRSEGFGLTIAEAMATAKPAIATAYGGNTDFMTPDNSYLVRYKLKEIDRDHWPYKKGWTWADPDLDHASALMRHAYENRKEAAAVGKRAREQILRLLHPTVVGRLLRDRLMTIASTRGMDVPALDTAGRAAAASSRKE